MSDDMKVSKGQEVPVVALPGVGQGQEHEKATSMITSNTLLVPRIESRIQVIRGLRVMLDVDLAALYGEQTKRLNEQVKRNRDRFPSDFLFQLTADEKTEVVANCDHLQNLKFSKALPFACTEHGAIQAAMSVQPKTLIRPPVMTMATNMSLVVEFFDAFPIAAIVSTLSAQLSWSKSCMQHCLKRASGWRGAGCCWGTWMMSDDMRFSKGLEFPVVALAGVGYIPAKGEDEQGVALATPSLEMGMGGVGESLFNQAIQIGFC